MFYSSTFTSSTFNHEFKRYQDLTRAAQHYNAPEILAEYEVLVKRGAQEPLYGDPTERQYKNPHGYKSKEDFIQYSRCHKFATCMDVSKEKGAARKVQTVKSCAEYDFVRYPQGFDPDVHLITETTLFDEWKKYSDYMQVSTGLTHMYRNILIVDCDNLDGSVTYESLCNTLTTRNMPSPNYIIIHHKEDRDTFQLGFLMEEAIRIKHCDGSDFVPTYYGVGRDMGKYYRLMYQAMNKILPGDPGFTGWRCKNPFYCQNADGFEVKWFTETPVAKWYEIRSYLGIPCSAYEIPKKPDPTDPKGKKKNNKRTHSSCNPNCNSGCQFTCSPSGQKLAWSGSQMSTSRNYYMRMDIADQMRKTKGAITESQMLAHCIEYSSQYAKLANKLEPQSVSEITQVVHSSYSHFKATYTKPVGPSKSQYTSESRSCSALKRSFHKLLKSLLVYSNPVGARSLYGSHYCRYSLSESALRALAQELLSSFNSTRSLFSEGSKNALFWSRSISSLEDILADFTVSSASAVILSFVPDFEDLKIAA